MRQERALTSATIINYVPFIRSFLEDRFGRGSVTLGRLCIPDIVRFVQQEAPRLNLKRAKLLTTALRSFLRYGRYRGDITLDLAAAVPPVANWSMTAIPRAIPSDQVRQLLASVNWHTAIGRRDHAFLKVAVQTGLRLSEMTGLKRDDVVLDAGAHVRVIGKGRKERCTPLAKSTVAVLKSWFKNLKEAMRACCSRMLGVAVSALMECITSWSGIARRHPSSAPRLSTSVSPSMY